MKLSIVLTVYNKAGFLKRSLESLLQQEGIVSDDYEVLAVDDGSTDDSSTILEGYSRNNKRLRIISQNNQGLSVARNNGIKQAMGDYIWCVDADDMISSNAVHLIFKAMSSSPDIIPIYARTSGNQMIRNRLPASINTGRDILLSRKWESCGVFWIMKKEFIEKNHLSFLPGIFHEDSEFTPRMLYYAESVTVIPEVLYTVFLDNDSITHVPRAKRAFDYLIVADSLLSFGEFNNESRTKIGRVFNSHISMIINNALNIIIQNNLDEQYQFEVCLNKKRHILRSLWHSAKFKYYFEGILFAIFPMKRVSVYKMLKRLL